LIATDAWPEPWNEQLHALWKRQAVAESWEYCAYSVAQRDLPMPGTTALMGEFYTRDEAAQRIAEIH
jgi:hypothetical protein